MFFGILEGLFVGWLLSLFDFNDVVIGALQSFASVDLSMKHYYFIFAFLGAVYGIFKQNS